MLQTRLFGILFFLLFAINTQAQRNVINIPDIPGYQTLKGDFHMHTVFSDGTVWPTVRVQEAWEEGLDVISITDHIEYRPHSTDMNADHNRSYEIAEPLANRLDLILVRGTEITRSMPPGHLNALFIKNANLLELEDVNDAIREARDQGAFLLWNHPGWKAQQPDTTLWWDEHTELLRNNMLHGIEIYNEEFSPEALSWANEKKLTMFGNSDEHGPSDYDNSHRPMTLIFSKSRTLGGIKDALFSRRTAVYFNNTIIGNSTFLNPLFFASLQIDKKPINLNNEESRIIYIENTSEIDYQLELAQPGVGFDAPAKLNLNSGQITAVELTGNSDEVGQMQNLEVYYEVKNLKVSNEDNLVITFTFQNI